jgi:hypothetical protein
VSGRIRSIKPEVAEDEIAVGLTDAAWRMWVTSWVQADDFGNLRASERGLAASVWQDTTRDARTPLLELIAKGRFEPYSVNGQHYVHIHAWEKHQRIDNARKRARLPSPDEDDGVWKQVLAGEVAWPRGELGDFAASLGGIPLARAPAHLAAGPRPPTSDPDQRPPTPAPSAVAEVAERTSTSKAGSRGTRIAADWNPSAATIAWCQQQRVDGLAHVDEFRDYWIALPGAKGVKLDWDATFKNRIRQIMNDGRAVPWEPPPEPPKPIVRVPPPPEAIAALRELEEKSAREEHIDVGEKSDAWRPTGGAP